MSGNNQSVAYAKLLELGESTARDLADSLGFSASKTSNLLSRLHKQGCVEQSSTRHWRAIDGKPPKVSKRGRPAKHGDVRSVIKQVLATNGSTKLSDIVDAVRLHFPATQDIRSIVTGAVAAMVSTGVVVHTGSRSRYAYELSEGKRSKERAA